MSGHSRGRQPEGATGSHRTETEEERNRSEREGPSYLKLDAAGEPATGESREGNRYS